MARSEVIEGGGGGSHHFTEEGLWREQTAWRAEGHITSLGRDWSVTCKNDMQGYSHPWTSFGL